MKILILALAFMLAACDGLPTSPVNTDLVTVDHEYEIDTWGSNSEVYEFTPKGTPQYNCILLLTDDVIRPTMECVPR